MTTREEWLNLLAGILRPVFTDVGATLPDKLRISCGWPAAKGLARKKRVIGQCWNHDCSLDGTTEVFVSPFLGTAYEAAETALHELIHAAVGNECGHKGAFIVVARKLGFTKPWTSTPASDELRDRLTNLIAPLGAYPHATLDSTKLTKAPSQGTRMVKLECPDCGYIARTTRKWLDERGGLICPCNGKPMQFEGGAGAGDEGEDEMKEAA